MRLCSYHALQRNFKKQISEPVEVYLNKPTPDMWDKVLKVFRDTLDKAESSYLTKAKSENHSIPSSIVAHTRSRLQLH